MKFALKMLVLFALAFAAGYAFAANLVGQYVLPDGRIVCVYSDGRTLTTSFNNCPSFIRDR
jgi:hypothetical protein